MRYSTLSEGYFAVLRSGTIFLDVHDLGGTLRRGGFGWYVCPGVGRS